MDHPALRAALPVLLTLEAAGFEAVFVGGCVRDVLARRPVTDVDIATAARPEQVQRLFARTVPTGLQHGTVTVLHEGASYEVTTFRAEREYERHRRPADVVYIDVLERDLCRRDFTINAMAMRADGSVVDPFRGQSDLASGVIRAVGIARERFTEDALRMLRGLRFAAQYGAGPRPIHPDTWRALLECRMLLRHIALERVGTELDKMTAGRRPDAAWRMVLHSELLAHAAEPNAWPEQLHCAASGRERVLDLLGEHELLGGLAGADSRWAALSLASGLDARQARAWFRALRYSGARIRARSDLVAFHLDWIGSREPVEARWAEQTVRYGRATAAAWLALARACEPLAPAGPDELEALQTQLAHMPAVSLDELAVDGRDLMRLHGHKGGPWLQRQLHALLLAVASGSVRNTAEALLRHASELDEREGETT
ncbi:CCA tRNA nucleotidyltransferase [Paenibacillus sp. IB182496]|uniref:CCA tRNA nucleotidyltransferase n=1 Tax=Paenibacillus sabuli TaxID=2772509 RepID=A0A927GRM2_9BACL|nr:CCA tRNA nucleotidyltransferase [Paenibacillus sabuli]MBD2845130.1 CCA tRNA nucleotidyltransferase [Paenibacillus sabuli]